VISYRITVLESRHTQMNFDCGELALNDYLQKYSTQNQKLGVSTTHIMETSTGEVMGYFSLVVSTLDTQSLPHQDTKRLPRYVERPPVILISRLALDNSYKGQGLGERLLIQALLKCYEVLSIAGIIAVIVDAKHQPAKSFYERYGFIATVDNPMRLYLTKKKLEAFIKPFLPPTVIIA
jgi:predicted GNAT family N-acyltransferase